LFIQNGLHFMRNNFYPKVWFIILGFLIANLYEILIKDQLVEGETCEIVLADQNLAFEIDEPMEHSELVENMVY
jgi:hypothetical protein